ncbi:unnamed protein product [Penicillium nalgiovense]|uniref:Methyltransferase domain-containing protein n=1 Tax=Penicillium nalgiovense TaxID=60175 RepID=A0A9W4HZI4_PENNA|nr:unnamed protein product [Penicillium nalgiovense]CAG7987506.1 unnamed protein product [Penicillium nalgiovense]CAG7988792.1 unnamed protein product [Penicillium nalgiovense]CAG7990573.1 unnamed protein product [Penicillium nalgiovense]CAG7996116.1 unnamed protein product [Penicillium nalgiovense]
MISTFRNITRIFLLNRHTHLSSSFTTVPNHLTALPTMAEESTLQDFFKSKDYASSFKRGEMVTRLFAEMLVDQSKVAAESNANPDQPLVVLDNACGTGVISSALNDKLDDSVKKMWKLTCGDISSPMIESITHRMQEEGWPNVEAKIVDAQKPELASAQFSHIFTAFAYMALPESLKALDETVRMLQPGGTIAFSTWIEPGWIAVARAAIESMPGDLSFPETPKLLEVLTDGQWDSKDWIESQLEERGFQDIDVRPRTTKLTITSPIFVDMTMLMIPMMVKTFWGEKQREEHQDKVRPAIEKYLEDTYGYGNIDTEWVAILSTARKSG